MGPDPPKGRVNFWGCPAHCRASWVTAVVCAAQKNNNGISATAAANCIAPDRLLPWKICPPFCDVASRQNSLTACLTNGWTLAGQEQFSGGNFHTNKDAGVMWCRDHSHRGQSFRCCCPVCNLKFDLHWYNPFF